MVSSFAPMQLAVAGAFTKHIPWHYLLTSLAWPIGFALLGMVIFWWKTRAWSVHTAPLSAESKADVVEGIASKNV